MCLHWPPARTVREAPARRMLLATSMPGLCRSPSDLPLSLAACFGSFLKKPTPCDQDSCGGMLGVVQGCMIFCTSEVESQRVRFHLRGACMGDVIGRFSAAGGSKQCQDALCSGVAGEEVRAPEGCARAPAECSVPGAAQLCCPPGSFRCYLHSACLYCLLTA